MSYEIKKIDCEYCKESFFRKQNKSKKHVPKFCSMKCYGDSKKGKPNIALDKKIEKKCLVCNKAYRVSPYRKDITQYCSRACTYRDHGKKILREKCHFWKGGATSNNSFRMTYEYKEWRLQIYRRDNYECQICGVKGKDLRANHIKKYSDYPNLRIELTNGIVICKDCDNRLVMRHEEEWESYFNFNLMARGYL